MIVYLHGFRSAPASHKALRLHAHLRNHGFGDRFWCEQLPVEPNRAVALAEAAIEHARAMGLTPALVGSSLGGFYAMHLAEKHGLRAVLLNPAVVAPLSLADYVGWHDNLYTGERFEFTTDHVAQLRRLDRPVTTRPERYLLIVETGDEVLDYWQAVLRFRGSNMIVRAGGDHSLLSFEQHLEAICAFCGLGEGQRPL